MYTTKQQKPQQSRVIANVKNNSVLQRGRVKNITQDEYGRNRIIFKFSFAGSGYRMFPSKYYHKGQKIDNFPYGHYERIYNSQTYHEIIIPGPQKNKGISDAGKHSIDNNILLAENVFLKIINISAIDPINTEIYVIIKGHSRGGVAASLFANWVKNTYRQIPYLNVELTLLDPVPGPSHSGEYNDITTLATQSTVIYSLTADRDLAHKIGFTPQIIRNADRIIITEEGHGCGTGIRDSNQKKVKYFFCDKYYSLSQLNSLPNGCYYAEKEYDETGQIRIQLWLIPKGSALADIKKLSKIHGRRSAIKTSILKK